MNNLEEILYDQNNIKITPILLINNNSTYLISNIEIVKIVNNIEIDNMDVKIPVLFFIFMILSILDNVFILLAIMIIIISIIRILFAGDNICINVSKEKIYLSKCSKEQTLEIFNALNLAIIKNKLI